MYTCIVHIHTGTHTYLSDSPDEQRSGIKIKHVQINQRVNIYTYVYLHTFTHTCTHTYLHIHTCTHTYTRTYQSDSPDEQRSGNTVNLWITQCVYIYTYIYIHTLIHTCTHTFPSHKRAAQWQHGPYTDKPLCTHIHLYIYMNTHIHTCKHTNLSDRVDEQRTGNKVNLQINHWVHIDTHT